MRNLNCLLLATFAILLLAAFFPQTEGLRMGTSRSSRATLDDDFERYAVRANRVVSASSSSTKHAKSRSLLGGCPATLTACGSLCADLTSDISNCGKCGSYCTATETCCSGVCVDIQTDVKNCGSCGSSCHGTCAVGTCNYGGVTGKSIPKIVGKMAVQEEASAFETFQFPRFHI
eukprot:TRINITY_DN2167_c0_g1_i1.p1 TRINITY_DN2167_c0_g1~~TRINITY_DN2167_c0_g1_i1.p1  ORF type:complete len:175 (-),score=5.56 TRINITY_DN2167_c0_g1_i1:396-920(-)